MIEIEPKTWVNSRFLTDTRIFKKSPDTVNIYLQGDPEYYGIKRKDAEEASSYLSVLVKLVAQAEAAVFAGTFVTYDELVKRTQDSLAND